jgi:uncharacterized membrane protein
MVYDQFQHTVDYYIFHTIEHWHYVDSFCLCLLMSINCFLLPFIVFSLMFCVSLSDALRAGILQQRSIFVKLVYSIGEELILTWTEVFILYGLCLLFSSSFYRVYTYWDMYLHLVHLKNKFTIPRARVAQWVR